MLLPIDGPLPRILIAFVLALSLACSSAEERAAQAQRDAQAALARGDRTAALDALKELRENRDDSPESLLRLVTLMVRAGESAHALWLLDQGVQKFPERTDLRIALARVALNLEEATRVLEVLEPIGPDSAQHPQALLLTAQGHIQLGNMEDGLAVLEEAERLYPDLAEARSVHISVLVREGRFDEALALLEKVRESLGPDEDPRQLDLQRVEIYLQEKKADEAIALLEKLVAADPLWVQAWRPLLRALVQQERGDEAATLLEAAIAENPEQPVLYSLLGDHYQKIGRREDAEATLRKYIEVSDSPSAYVALGSIYAQTDDVEGYLAVIQEGLEKFPDEPLLQFREIDALLVLHRTDEAREVLASLRERVPEGIDIRLFDARILLLEGNTTEARKQLLDLVSEADRADLQFWLGRVLEEEGDFLGAQRSYRLALTRDPQDKMIARALVQLTQKRGDWRLMTLSAAQLVRLTPGDPDAYNVLTNALIQLGDYKRAATFAAAYMKRFPEIEDSAVQASRALRSLGEFDRALEVIDAAEKRIGPSLAITAERATIYGATGRVDEGITLVQEAQKENPDSYRLQVSLAGLLFAAGRAEEGTKATDRALELDPDNLIPLRIRAEYLATIGQLDAAQRDIERYLAARPNDAALHYTLGGIHAKAGRTDAAVASLRRAAQLDERAILARNNLAMLLESQGDLDGALTVAQEAYALAESNPYVLDTLGWLYLQKGLAERSITILEKAREAAPEYRDAQLHLALAYRDAGRPEDARPLLSELAEQTDHADDIRAQAETALRSLD